MIRQRVGARLAPLLLSLLLFLLLLALLVLQLSLLDTAGSLSVTVAAGAALVACALLAARSVPVMPPTRVRTAIRDRARRTAFLPQRDPDAAGRSRPRAPGCALPTTAVA